MPDFEAVELDILNDDETTSLIDLNELVNERAVTGFGLVSFDAGQHPVQPMLMTDDGAIVADVDEPPATMAIELVLCADTYPLLRAAYEDLCRLVKQGGTWRLKEHPDTAYAYYECLPSTPPVLLDGPDAYKQKVQQLIASLRFEVLRQPWRRLAKTTATPASISNAVGARAFKVTNPGDRPSPMRMTVDVNAGNVGLVELGIRAEGDLDEYIAKHAQRCFDGTSKLADTGPVTDSGVQLMRCNFFVEDAMMRRFRQPPIVLDDPTSFEGVHRAKVRLRGTGGEMRVGIRYDFTGDEVAGNAPPVIPLEFRDMDTPDFVEIDMGIVVVPKGVSRIDIDVFVERTSGTGEIDFEQVALVPATRCTFIAATPGLRMGEAGHERFDADVLDGTGVMINGNFGLFGEDEVAHTRPIAGFTLPAGVHTFAVFGGVREPTETEREVARLEIVEAVSGDDRGSVAMRSRKNRLWTYFGKRPKRKPRKTNVTVTADDITNGIKFLPQVRQTADTKPDRYVLVSAITHSFLRAATLDTPIVIDSFTRRCYVQGGASEVLFTLNPENNFPMAPGGEFAAVLTVHDIPPDPGYEDLDERESLAKSVLTRASSVTTEIWPRETI
jgi:hypothetical protein